MSALYDVIGRTYRHTREPDPRIAAAIAVSLEECASVLNVGAGAGSYEVAKEPLIALEPSITMIRQRPAGAAPVVCGRAEALPFADKSFDGVSCLLTVHHWSDQRQGITECSRVARKRVAFLTIDIEVLGRFWLFEYFPALLAVDRKIFPSLESFGSAFGSIDATTVLIPENCRDGFLGAFWKRPQAYLDERVRGGISTFARLNPQELEVGLQRLRADLDSGEWQHRQRGLSDRCGLDLGYRILNCRPP